MGGDMPAAPFPVVVDTTVTAGFGRGSSELGIPTANIPPGVLSSLDAGVYYGWAAVHHREAPSEADVCLSHGREISFNFGRNLLSDEDGIVFPMVMSIGWNPYFGNKEKSAEVHILHKFTDNFYGCAIKVAVLGFIRAEQSYNSLDELIQDIQTDILVAERSLDRPAYIELKELVAFKP